MIGTTVSHYRIVESIGAGGMGVVYLAEDDRLHRKVALKFLPPTIAEDSHARARLLREAQAASALDHPNVATVYDVGDWNGQLFIAMPFYDGETLRQRIERGPLGVSEAGWPTCTTPAASSLLLECSAVLPSLHACHQISSSRMPRPCRTCARASAMRLRNSGSFSRR